ncbi:NDR1/HIN1-like protein 2 [Cornus florida]|uniref:NDR1/HIN1-like protein 2 n=1 Tax=Cornus florida TaxID=4283 RepID=UPI002898739C|nr:NDR1/HIN1-like protein 2 [Cornus florida]
MATPYLPRASQPQPSYHSFYPGDQTTSNPSAYEIQQTQQTNNYITRVRRLILALFLLFAMIISVSMIAWLMLQPRVPIFRVDSLSVSNFTLNDSQLTADFGIKFTVRNPNKRIDLTLDDFKISVSHDRNKLAEKTWNHYVSMKKMSQNGMSIELGTNSSDNCPIKRKTAIGMSREFWSKRAVNLKVKMMVWAKFEAGDWLSKQKFVEVCCNNLEVGFFTSNVTGTLIDGSNDCFARLS